MYCHTSWIHTQCNTHSLHTHWHLEYTLLAYSFDTLNTVHSMTPWIHTPWHLQYTLLAHALLDFLQRLFCQIHLTTCHGTLSKVRTFCPSIRSFIWSWKDFFTDNRSPRFLRYETYFNFSASVLSLFTLTVKNVFITMTVTIRFT